MVVGLVFVETGLTTLFQKVQCGRRGRNKTQEFSERRGSGNQQHSQVKVLKLNPYQLYYTLSHEGMNVQGVEL